MPSKAKKDKPLATFTYPVRVGVRKAKFRPLESVALLDLSRLQKGSHKVEVGFAEGECCKRLVTAIVRNGMVADIEIEDCPNSNKPAGKEALALIEAARRKIGIPTPSP